MSQYSYVIGLIESENVTDRKFVEKQIPLEKKLHG